MNTTKAITLRLDPVDYDRLEAEAKRLGMPLATLARVYVRAALDGTRRETTTERNRCIGLEALDRLAELTADLPPVDAVQIARESREELERRLSF